MSTPDEVEILNMLMFDKPVEDVTWYKKVQWSDGSGDLIVLIVWYGLLAKSCT